MRSVAGGGLADTKTIVPITRRMPNGLQRKFREVLSVLAAWQLEMWRIARVSTNVVPMHSARTMNTASVSWPVCSSWSHWSNICNMGHTKHVIKTSQIITEVDARRTKTC